MNYSGGIGGLSLRVKCYRTLINANFFSTISSGLVLDEPLQPTQWRRISTDVSSISHSVLHALEADVVGEVEGDGQFQIRVALLGLSLHGNCGCGYVLLSQSTGERRRYD